MPDWSELEQAGETLRSLGEEGAAAPLRYKRDMLGLVSRGIYVDVLARRVVCVKPYPPLVPLFSMDGLQEEDGCSYVQEKEA